MPADLETELLVTYARQHRRARQERRSQAEPPLPWHEPASALLRLLRATQSDTEAHTAAIARGWALLDDAPAPQCLGPCDCGAVLWAEQPARHGDEVTCRRCARTLPVAGRRALLLRLAEDVLVDYATASRALPLLLGRELATSTLRSWVYRGEIVPQAWAWRGTTSRARPHRSARPLLRLGDVLERVAGPPVNTMARNQDECDAVEEGRYGAVT